MKHQRSVSSDTFMYVAQPSHPARQSDSPLTMLFEGLLEQQEGHVSQDFGAIPNYLPDKAQQRPVLVWKGNWGRHQGTVTDASPATQGVFRQHGYR